MIWCTDKIFRDARDGKASPATSPIHLPALPSCGATCFN